MLNKKDLAHKNIKTLSLTWTLSKHTFTHLSNKKELQTTLVNAHGYITFYSILFSFIGSPAEKADLEVADEILEINGQSLENSSHTDIIAHIHNVSRPSSTSYSKFVVIFVWN